MAKNDDRNREINFSQRHAERFERLSKAAISVDCVVFGYDHEDLKILTIHSELDEFRGMHCLVGDLVQPQETLEAAAIRILEERTGLTDVPLEQVKTFGDPTRHPSGRVITIAFYTLINIDDYTIDTLKDLEPEWVEVKSLETMAFDHIHILHESLQKLRRRFFSDALFANLLPDRFTLSELQLLSEEVLQRKFDKRNFRKKMLNADILIDTGEQQVNVSHRPAKLYQISQSKLHGVRSSFQKKLS